MGGGVDADASDDKQKMLEVRVAKAEADKQRVFHFRYQVYVEEMGKRPQEADHTLKQLRDPLDDSGIVLFMEDQGRVIASARFHSGSVCAEDSQTASRYRLDLFDEFGLDALSFGSRLMIAPSWRGTRALGRLLSELYSLGRKQRACFNFVHCAPGLVDFYEQLGYLRYSDGFMEGDLGYRVPMVFVIEDVAHMRAVRSPLYRLARRYDNNEVASHWFHQKFPQATRFINRRLLGDDEFWGLLGTRLQSAQLNRIPILEGLSGEDTKAFLRSSSVLNFSRGEVLIRPGDSGKELFIALSGTAEVLVNDSQQKISVALVGPGQCFGEISFLSESPRSAWVVALTEMEVLTITQQALKKSMVTLPTISAQILYNLSQVLCERLRVSNQILLDMNSESYQKGTQDE